MEASGDPPHVHRTLSKEVAEVLLKLFCGPAIITAYRIWPQGSPIPWLSESKGAEPFFIVVVKSITYIPQENKAHTQRKGLKERTVRGEMIAYLLLLLKKSLS